MAKGYPIILNIEGRRCLVLGSGAEAEEKAGGLAACGASVDRREQYEPGCLRGYFLAIAAGPERASNAGIFAEGEREGVLVNCLDDPAHCRFTFPSVLRRGELIIAISTGGACPALAVRLRERLAREIGPEYAEFLERARALRARIAASVPGFDERRALWYALVDSPALELLRAGEGEAAQAALDALLPPDALS